MKGMIYKVITGEILKQAVISGANNISNNRVQVDELNVFPVPDGDTGTNMSLTIGNAAKELNVCDETSVGDIAKTTAGALLRGARGNSGVILSLIFRGLSKGFKDLETADGADLVVSPDKDAEGYVPGTGLTTLVDFTFDDVEPSIVTERG